MTITNCVLISVHPLACFCLLLSKYIHSCIPTFSNYYIVNFSQFVHNRCSPQLLDASDENVLQYKHPSHWRPSPVITVRRVAITISLYILAQAHESSRSAHTYGIDESKYTNILRLLLYIILLNMLPYYTHSFKYLKVIKNVVAITVMGKKAM